MSGLSRRAIAMDGVPVPVEPAPPARVKLPPRQPDFADYAYARPLAPVEPSTTETTLSRRIRDRLRTFVGLEPSPAALQFAMSTPVDFSALQSELHHAAGVERQAVSMLDRLHADLKGLRDPSDPAAIDSLIAQLQTTNAALAEAVAANTSPDLIPPAAPFDGSGIDDEEREP